jgi:hypothetical protein
MRAISATVSFQVAAEPISAKSLFQNLLRHIRFAINSLGVFVMKKNWIRISPVPQTANAVSDLEASWTYAQKTGDLQQDGKQVSTGYSGANEGKNNPAMENVPNVGPIPRGQWTIAGPPTDSKDHGPYVLRLDPVASTETHGRSGFLMHGDSKEHPGSASHGCIVLPRAVREEVWTSGDRELEVVAEIPEERKAK